LLLDLARHLVDERCLDEQWTRERDVLIPAFALCELLVAELVTAEIQLELLSEVLDGTDLFEDFLDPFIQEPIEGLPLDGDEVRKGEHLIELGETDTVPSRNELVRQS
jgi:hypothetical protein